MEFHCVRAMIKPCWARGLGQCEFCLWDEKQNTISKIMSEKGKADDNEASSPVQRDRR